MPARPRAARRTALAAVTVGALVAASACTADSSSVLSPAVPGSSAPSPVFATPSPTTSAPTAPTSPPHLPRSAGKPRRALLTILTLDLVDLPVLPYRGRTDDAPGTRIQDGGVAASPHGPRGGVGPGGVGNYQVTAHRTSSTRAFEDLPQLRRGDRVQVHTGQTTYVYEVRRTRRTSFRSPASLADQRAAVPGRPGVPATRAFLTLSTCATPEDHAAGNYWSDRFKNPEHRIDKIGVLVAVRSPRG